MYNMIIAAGWPVWPLLLTSIIALAILMERFWFLQRQKICPTKTLEGARQIIDLRLQANHDRDALLSSLESSSPLGKILSVGLTTFFRSRDKELAISEIQEAAIDLEIQLQRYMGALATIATIAPLLGLFGTVVGMIEIFGSQQNGVANPQQLAHGISIALYNTAFGLLIAIPSYTGWRILRSMIDERKRECELAVKELLAHLQCSNP